MTDDQIEMMIAGYGRNARMAADAGFDGAKCMVPTAISGSSRSARG